MESLPVPIKMSIRIQLWTRKQMMSLIKVKMLVVLEIMNRPLDGDDNKQIIK